MAIDPILLAGLREEAKAHFASGDKFRAASEVEYARGKDIEKAINLLEGKSTIAVGIGRSSAKGSANAVGIAVQSGRKGKPPGAMSQRWRGNLAEIIRMIPEPHIFGFNHVQDVVKRREGREMRSSEIRRLFEGNVKHGYLVQPSRDLYQPTKKLIELIGLTKHEGPPASTEGPHAGGVAERLNAPDYESGEDKGERPTTNAPQASVGSNPTASAPFASDAEKLSLHPFFRNPNQPNR